MVALTELQHNLQVCENNRDWRITGAKRVDRRRMNDLREDIRMQFRLTGRTASEKSTDVGRSLGVDDGGLISKERIDGETVRQQERTAIKMGRRHQKGCEKGRGRRKVEAANREQWEKQQPK